MRVLLPFFSVAVICLLVIGCTPVEKQAYTVIVGAKAFIDSEKKSHPECSTAPGSTICVNLVKATAAKDALIDAVEVYCASPAFLNGGPCTPPAKGTPAATQATAKLQAAISAYNQTEKDVKGAIQ